MRYVAKLRYDGANFSGFQVQPNARTVQGTLCTAAGEAFGVPCAVTGCSRTDSGVHAEVFCAMIEPLSDGGNILPPDRLPQIMAPYLPPDLSVTASCEAPEGFHPRYGVLDKEYCYRILNTRVRDPFLDRRAWHLPRYIDGAALAEMNRAAAYLIGRHDFHAFMAEGKEVENATRTVKTFSCARVGDIIEVRVSADGFLYNMVRILVGTLVGVAKGQLSADEIPAILASKDRTMSGMTAPPDGLYLAKVRYPAGVLPPEMGLSE